MSAGTDVFAQDNQTILRYLQALEVEAEEQRQRRKDESRLRRAILPRNLGKLGGRRRATGYLYE